MIGYCCKCLDGQPRNFENKLLIPIQGCTCEVIYTNGFDDNSDLSTTYLGQTKVIRDTKIKAEERFPITTQGFISGKLLDGTACQILLDTGATRSYKSKSYYLK